VLLRNKGPGQIPGQRAKILHPEGFTLHPRLGYIQQDAEKLIAADERRLKSEGLSALIRAYLRPGVGFVGCAPPKRRYFMETSRRDFCKISTAGAATAALLGFDLKPAYAQLRELKIARATETHAICPYCAVGCGVLIYTIGDNAKNVTPEVIHVEGDPDHPTNRGTLCPKGASLYQDILNPRRLLKPQVRRPGSDHWEDISWDHALDEIAHRMKKIRDDTFIEKDAQGRTVNRCETLAFTGGCTDTNEFNYLVVKTMRGLGLTYIENQARL
jgi:formate dehydrogenase major subunit